jgi:hypothetical protein
MAKKILEKRRLLAAGVATVMALAGTAAAAGSTTPVSGGGDGHAAIADYAVSAGSATYTVDEDDPQALNQVRFQLSPTPPAGALVRARINTGSTWYACSLAGAIATCNTISPVQARVISGSTVANELRVLVVDQ